MSIYHPHPFETSIRNFQAFPIHFPRCPKMLQEGSHLLQEAKIQREKHFLFYHISTNMNIFTKMFHGDINMDEGNMLK